MRKYKREIMRSTAIAKGYKPSAYVHYCWNAQQEMKLGVIIHKRNVYRSTRPRYKWGMGKAPKVA